MRKAIVNRFTKRLEVCNDAEPENTDRERSDDLRCSAGAEKDECAREDHLAHRAAELEPPVLRLVLVVH